MAKMVGSGIGMDLVEFRNRAVGRGHLKHTSANPILPIIYNARDDASIVCVCSYS